MVDVGAIFGLDAGGSLAKLIYFERTGPPLGGRASADHDAGGTSVGWSGGGGGGEYAASSPDTPPPRTTLHRVKSLVALARSPPSVAGALFKFYAFMRAKLGQHYVASAVHEGHLSFESPLLGGTLHFLHCETRDLEQVVGLLARQDLTASIARLGCTGGGSVKYRRVLEEQLGVEVVDIDEMASLVRGLEFVVGNVVGECYTYRPQHTNAAGGRPSASSPRILPAVATTSSSSSRSSSTRGTASGGGSAAGRRQRSLTWTESFPSPSAADLEAAASSPSAPTPSPTPTQTPSPVMRVPWSLKVARPGQAVRSDFPYLLVSIGSGVSIIRVDGPDGQHQRVSGSSIGGGTFFGLARYLVEEDAGCGVVQQQQQQQQQRRGAYRKRASFDELLELAATGDACKCDMMVGDIYGHDYTKIGLSSDVVASSFGKAMHAGSEEESRPEDRARALLMMVTNNIAQVAYLNAKQHHTNRIYFIGNFLRRNVVSCQRLSYAINFWSGGVMEALFLEHEGYFGALGAFILSAQGTEGGAGPGES